MNTLRRNISILALSDGRPGHFNKTKALINALAAHAAVQVNWQNVNLRFSALRPFLSFLINKGLRLPSASWLKLFYSGASSPISPDLIISTGGNTLYANVLLARVHGCPNIFIGGLRRLDPVHFWRVISHKHSHPSPPYLYWPTTLVDIQPHVIQEKGEALIKEHGLASQRLWALLVGGDGSGYHYEPADFSLMTEMMALAHRKHGVRWLIVSSRRTGTKNEQHLRGLLDLNWVAAASWSSEQGSSAYHAMLGAAERIVCTEDSHMMLTEAIATGKPVLSIRPDASNPTQSDFLAHYLEEGYLSRQTLTEAAREDTHWNLGEQPRFSAQLNVLGERLHSALADGLTQPHFDTK